MTQTDVEKNHFGPDAEKDHEKWAVCVVMNGDHDTENTAPKGDYQLKESGQARDDVTKVETAYPDGCRDKVSQ